MNDHIKGPIIYDSLDRPNAPQHTQQQNYRPRMDWRNTLIIVTAGLGVCVTMFFFLYKQLNTMIVPSMPISSIYLATFLLWILYITPVFLLAAASIILLRYLHILTRRATLVNIMTHQTTIAGIERNVEDRVYAAMDKYLDVMLERASESQFSGVSTLTYDTSDRSQRTRTELPTTTQSKEKEPLEATIPIKDIVLESNKPILEELKSRGLINRSNDSLLIGFSNNKPQYLEWSSFGVFGIAGKSRSGKSSTTKFLLAQMAMMGVELIICDGHGNAGQASLTSALDPLKGKMIYPLAIRSNDIFKAIEFTAAIVQRRVGGIDKNKHKIALVIDEFTKVMLELQPEQLRLIAKLLLSLANEAAKTNVRVFILGQNWAADFIGSASVRSSMTGYLLHKLDERELKFFIPSAPLSIRKQLAALQPGEAIYMGTTEPIKVTVPYVTHDDIAREVSSAVSPYFQDSTSMYETSAFIAIERDETADEDNIDMDENIDSESYFMYFNNVWSSHAELIEIMSKYIQEEMPKTKIIYGLFRIKPGNTKKYRAASKLYTALYNKYYNKHHE